MTKSLPDIAFYYFLCLDWMYSILLFPVPWLNVQLFSSDSTVIYLTKWTIISFNNKFAFMEMVNHSITIFAFKEYTIIEIIPIVCVKTIRIPVC